MSIAQLAPAHIRAISPYQPGKPISELAREMGIAEAGIIKLASNENPLGMSPRAKAAAITALDDCARYPDGSGFELKQALCARYGVAMEQIVLGNGSNDVLELSARSFLTSATEAIYAQHAFAVYALATQAVGANGVEVAAKNYAHDVDAMLGAITAQTRMVFIANPNNPTGTLLAGNAIEAFLEQAPARVLVVLDEAYNEYLPPEARYDSTAWLTRFPNLIITRTFSKIYGLAGLRAGFALAHPEAADLMNRVRQPFNVSSIAMAAACAALADTEFVAQSYALNRQGMARIVAGLSQLGLEHIPSFANFITFRVDNAAQVNRSLLQQGVIVRPLAGYAMPQHLRVTIGLESESERFLDALAKALKT